MLAQRITCKLSKIYHSPKVRTIETAEILSKCLSPVDCVALLGDGGVASYA